MSRASDTSKTSVGPTSAPSPGVATSEPVAKESPEKEDVAAPEGPAKVACVIVEGQPFQLCKRGETWGRDKVFSFYNEHGLIIRKFFRDDYEFVDAVPTRAPHPVSKKMVEVPE